MLCLKLLCAFSLLLLVLGAPADENLEKKKRVERNRRQLIDDEVSKHLDLENYAPLKIVEASLEANDGHGDNEVNGTKLEDGKNIEYFHKKNKGTIKTIVEEKKNNKMEDVFYHVSYEKQQDGKDNVETTTLPEETTTLPEETTTLPEETTTLVEETTQDTTDQTLDQDETMATEEITYRPEVMDAQNNVFEKQQKSDEDDDLPNDEDITIPSLEKDTENSNNVDLNEQQQQQYMNNDNNNNNGWFSNWFNWLSNGQNVGASSSVSQNQNNDQPQSDAAQYNTDALDNAIDSQQITFLSPFYFGSVGLKSPSCPSHRSTLVSIYFFSFCV